MKILKSLSIIALAAVAGGFIGTTVGSAMGKTETVKTMLGDMQYTCKYKYFMPDNFPQEQNIVTTNGELRNLNPGDIFDGIRVLIVYPVQDDTYSFMAKNKYSTFDVTCHKGGIWEVQ